MSVASVMLVTTLFAMGAPAEDPFTVEAQRLGAPRYADREAAARLLERGGRSALPALREARKANDPEVRARSMALITRIESQLMVRPTMVELNFQDQPITEVLKSISQRTGNPILLMPENSPQWQGMKVNLESPTPVPFWDAMDRLSKVAKIQHSVSVNWQSNQRGPVVQVSAGMSASDVPPSDSGPFRVSLLGIQRHLQRNYVRNGMSGTIIINNGGVVPPNLQTGGNPVIEQFYLDLQVAVEPRMTLTQHGALKLVEAIDDRGQSLLPADSAETDQRFAGYYGITQTTGASSLQTQIHLRYPQQAGKTIKRLRGSVPVVVAARKDDPLVIPLGEAKGKMYQSEDFQVVVHEVRMAAEQGRPTIDLTLRPGPSAEAANAGGRFGAELMAFRNSSVSLSQNQVEIVDAQGKPYAQWYPSSTTRVDTDEVRMTLTLMPSDQVGAPAQLRVYNQFRAEADAHFEFHDVPIF